MRIYYVNSNNKTINLDEAPYYMTEHTNIFDCEWGYDTAHNKVESLRKEITKPEMQVAIKGISKQDCYAKRDEFFDLTDVDCVKGTPGKLYFGDYYIECYLVGNVKNSKYIGNSQSLIDLKVVNESKSWIKETRHDFIYSQSTDESGRGYEYGYEYDYAMSSGNTNRLKNEHFAPCHFIMKISGYASTPSITIGDHIYRVHETIQNNEILTIDSKAKTITLTKNNGVQVNLFSKRDKESYIFEKIPSGDLNVYWNSEFNFEVTLFEERGEPKWT